MKVQHVTAVALVALFVGCAGHGAIAPTSQSHSRPAYAPSSPRPSPSPTANFFVSMAYSSMPPTIDPSYGELDGYARISSARSPVVRPTPIQTAGPSGVAIVPCNTNIQFLNFDKMSFHTLSVLRPDQNGNFPMFFNNPNGPNPSVPLTPLSDPNFSTGLVVNDSGRPGYSAVYATGQTSGIYYAGDYVNYDSTPSMRTVVIVNGC